MSAVDFMFLNSVLVWGPYLTEPLSLSAEADHSSFLKLAFLDFASILDCIFFCTYTLRHSVPPLQSILLGSHPPLGPLLLDDAICPCCIQVLYSLSKIQVLLCNAIGS